MSAFTNTEWWIVTLLFTPVILYFLLLLLCTLAWRQVSLSKKVKQHSGKVSVIVAARNESAGIRKFLLNIFPLTSKAGAELIIVDDQSEDDTHAVLNQLSDKHPFKVLQNIHPGSAPKQTALKLGVENSTGETLLFTDADCFPHENWIPLMVEAVNNDTVLASGPVRITGNGFLAGFQKLEQMTLMAFTNLGFRMGKPFLASGANLVVKKDAFARCGGYKGSLSASGDDIILLKNIRKTYPGQCVFVGNPKAMVDTEASNEVKSFFSQRIRWAAKNGKYRDPLSLFFGAVIFLTGLSMAMSVFILLFSGKFIPCLFFVWGLKILADLILFLRISGFFKQSGIWPLIVVGQPFFVVYTIWVTIRSMSGKFSWKNRKLQ